MSTNNQIEYDEAFSCRFKWFLRIINLITVLSVVCSAITFSAEPSAEPAALADAGRWLAGVVITPYVALIAAFVWMRSRMKSWPDKLCEPASLAFALGGLCLIFSVLFLALPLPMESNRIENRLIAVGVAISFGFVVFLLLGVLTVLKAWNAYRDMIECGASE